VDTILHAEEGMLLLLSSPLLLSTSIIESTITMMHRMEEDADATHYLLTLLVSYC
jgi:hypothetical protein